jgi:hypothetical protein
VHLPGIGATKPRLDLYAAARALAGTPLPRDTAPPKINSIRLGAGGGAVVGTRAPYAIDASDAGGGAVELMCLTFISTAASGLACSPWVPFQANGTVRVPFDTTVGPVTLTAFVTDDSGNTSPGARATAVYDPLGPYPWLSLAGVSDGDVALTRFRNVSVVVSDGVLFSPETTTVCLSEIATTAAECGGPQLKGFVPYAPVLPYTLTLKTNGIRALRAFFSDKSMTLPVKHKSASLDVMLDTAPPKLAPQKATFAATPAAGGAVNVAFARDATDATSGVGAWLVALQAGKVKACTGLGAGAQVATVDAGDGSAASAAFSGLAAGTAYQVRLCAVDKAGNVAKGQVRSFKAL